MLNKINRVTKAKQFAVIFRKTKPIYTDNFVFRFYKGRNQEVVKFGFVISNKIEKCAAKRNLIKRQMRSIARDLISGVEKGYDVVVVVKSLPKDLPFNSIKMQFINAIKKNTFFNEKNTN